MSGGGTSGRDADPASGRTVRLRYAVPYAVGPMLTALAGHAVPGVERSEVDQGRHTRTLRAPGGPALVRVAFTRPDSLDVRVWLTDVGDLPSVTATVRRWLDLDVDPGPVEDALGADPLLGPLVRGRPGLRVLGAADGFELAVTTVLGQQVSVRACRTLAGRLVAAYGTPLSDGWRLFPSPAELAAVPTDALRAAVGLTAARAATLTALARAVADGLPLTAGDDLTGAEPTGVDTTEFRRRLLELPGVGPWTADYLAVRVLRDPDAFTPGDLVLRRALGSPPAQEAARMAERWRPFRAYALAHLWAQEAARRGG